VTRGNSAFAIELYRRLVGAGTGNLFLSPYSISTAMAMVATGARGETAKEIEAAFHFTATGPELAKTWRALLDDVNRHEPNYDLVTANALWAAPGVRFLPEYLAIAREQFDATLETLDFAHAAEAARAHINEWVATVTRQKIRDLIGPGMLSAATLMVLTNAIYMKAAWYEPFMARNTDANGRFHGAGGESTIPMMRQTESFRFLHAGGVRVIELPYDAKDLSMLVVLPDAVDGLDAVEKALTADKLEQWITALKPQRVVLSLPRFAIESSFTLTEVLQKLGVRLAFNTAGLADFSGMAHAEELLTISDVIHKARVDVTEEGTEAAAATAMVLRAGAMMREAPPEVFQADHPFLFVIRCRGSVLFLGRLMKAVMSDQ
jgi:serpin B